MHWHLCKNFELDLDHTAMRSTTTNVAEGVSRQLLRHQLLIDRLAGFGVDLVHDQFSIIIHQILHLELMDDL